MEWESLVDLLERDGHGEDLKDERWKDETYRAEHLDHVINVLGQWTKQYRVDDLFQLGQLMRFPWAPIQSPNEILESPQLKARGFFTDLEHSELGSVISYPGMPYRFSSRYSMPRKRAPLVGEDNEQVYEKEMGLRKEDTMRLSRLKAI
jgi:crotonobetainyl-CoA:carnitine CoA-transferase CaiB-like acyl-CoA transferase